MTEKKPSKKKYKIVYDRSGCIGAAACAAVAPEFWKMVGDGKADLIDSSVKDDGKTQELVIEVSKDDMKSALEANKEAAEVCPVQVIHIYDLETKEKII